MAITINRNNEISKEEIEALKRRFRKKTLTKAIYACIKFVLENQQQDFLAEIDLLNYELKQLKTKHQKLISTIRKKYIIDHEFEQILLEE